MAIVEPSLGEAYAHLQATYGARIPFSISFLTHFFWNDEAYHLLARAGEKPIRFLIPPGLNP